ncbi:hypothetical protein OpiT1DRAFT_03338 [Opitutaceae bacterium TAV1]|nr:hypothetical protein OpiT1DRAFT_03338 [Opitutaceae bacterium TAV1]
MKKNYKTLSSSLATFAALLALASPLRAADASVDLVYWTFNSAGSFPSGGPATAYSVATGITATGLTRIAAHSISSAIGINNTGGIGYFQRSAAGELRVASSSYTNGGTGASAYNNFSLTTALARDNYLVLPVF